MTALCSENECISVRRKAFLDQAFETHLNAEIKGDIPAVVATYAEKGHLNYNGVLYDTPEKLAAFHVGFGFSNKGMLADLDGKILNKTYMFDSLAVEFRVHCTVELPPGTPARRIEMSSLTIYQFNDEGKIVSERAFNDTGAILPEPVVPRFYTGWTKDD